MSALLDESRGRVLLQLRDDGTLRRVDVGDGFRVVQVDDCLAFVCREAHRGFFRLGVGLEPEWTYTESVLAVLAAVVAFTAPLGFTENATLDARASWVAGAPVHVYCASTDAVWDAFVTTDSPDAPRPVNGLTPAIGGTETYLSPETCAPILLRLSKGHKGKGHKEQPSLLALGAALDVLTHESIHMSGLADEGQTECKAIHALSGFLVKQWGFKRGSHAFLTVMHGAWNYHNALPPEYRAVC